MFHWLVTRSLSFQTFLEFLSSHPVDVSLREAVNQRIHSLLVITVLNETVGEMNSDPKRKTLKKVHYTIIIIMIFFFYLRGEGGGGWGEGSGCEIMTHCCFQKGLEQTLICSSFSN